MTGVRVDVDAGVMVNTAGERRSWSGGWSSTKPSHGSSTAVAWQSTIGKVVSPRALTRLTNEAADTVEYLEKDVRISTRMVGLTFEVRSRPFTPPCRCLSRELAIAAAPCLTRVTTCCLYCDLPQFGMRWQGVKYDAVLKRVKATSPFFGQLQPGDRLVAINGRRVGENVR
jgi:hypothetical protein